MKHCKNKSNLSVVADYLAGERPFTQLSMHISEQGKYRKNGEKWKDRNGIEWTKENQKKPFHQINPAKPSRRPIRHKPKTTPFSQEEYFKLIEIRGYLAIQEQFAHVKALDKLLSQIIIKPIDNSGEFQ